LRVCLGKDCFLPDSAKTYPGATFNTSDTSATLVTADIRATGSARDSVRTGVSAIVGACVGAVIGACPCTGLSVCIAAGRCALISACCRALIGTSYCALVSARRRAVVSAGRSALVGASISASFRASVSTDMSAGLFASDVGAADLANPGVVWAGLFPIR